MIFNIIISLLIVYVGLMLIDSADTIYKAIAYLFIVILILKFWLDFV